MTERIYLDHNATTPVAEEVVAAMSRFLSENYGNPSSNHWAGLPARAAIDKARSQVASLLGCDAADIVFTSGGTEANNAAIKGLYFAGGPAAHFHVITSRIEHPAVLEPCAFLENLGAEITRVPVDRFGRVNPDDVRRAIKPETALISIMHANNEVGTIQPISDIGAIAKEHGVPFHTDAAQTVGKISADVNALGVDLLSVAGHKLYGPKGVGALFIRKGTKLAPLLHGAGHEGGRRAGTENVLEIVGLGAASELARDWINDERVALLRDEFWQAIQARLGDRVTFNGHPAERLPNTLSVSFRGYTGTELLSKMPDVAASTGSACHADRNHISPVLAAMGTPPEFASGTIRFSLGRTTRSEELDSVAEVLARHYEA
jgi:cysteine desulfurase